VSITTYEGAPLNARQLETGAVRDMEA